MQLDTVDLRILAELQQDSSLTNVALARRVHLSPSPCLMRVKALETNGVIQRYRFILKRNFNHYVISHATKVEGFMQRIFGLI